MTYPLFGCIADDFTGATDLASNLVEAGMNVVQFLDLPESFDAIADANAVVIAFGGPDFFQKAVEMLA